MASRQWRNESIYHCAENCLISYRFELMHKRNISLILLGAIIIGVLAIWLVGYLLTKPVPVTFAKTPSAVINVSFESESGSSISGWLYGAEEPVGLAVLMHGIRSNRAQMVARAEQLLELNITSLVFDFQAHGESAGRLITLGHLEALDAQAAVSYVKSIDSDLPVLAIGVSMGGAAALLAEPALEADVLILESVYPDITTAISNRLSARLPGGHLLTPLLSYQIMPRTGISASKLSPANEASRVVAATLVLSGSEDAHTTIEDTLKLYEALPGPKSIEIINGAGHVDLEYYDNDTYWEIVQPFIIEHLALDA